ncbi:hypothetical protein KJZ67_04265 [Patescibacteria group bacterium]|nr:hypothetical protein [Patescibacteria group bacterium]
MNDRYAGNVRFMLFMFVTLGLAGLVALIVAPTLTPYVSLLNDQPEAAVSYQMPTVSTEVAPTANYSLTKDQFPNGHHVLVCNPNCDFGIWDALTESFLMGTNKTSVPYTETMTVFPHVKEGALEVNQTYVIATISTYTIYVNGEVLDGMFEGIFNGKDANGHYQFTVVNSAATSPILTPGQIVTTPYLHGGFLNPNSK